MNHIQRARMTTSMLNSVKITAEYFVFSLFHDMVYALLI